MVGVCWTIQATLNRIYGYSIRLEVSKWFLGFFSLYNFLREQLYSLR